MVIKDMKQNETKALIKTNIELFLILIYWELLLYYQLHKTILSISIWNILFMLPLSCLLTFILSWSKSRKVNNIFKILLTFIVSIFYLGELIYYKIFGSLLSVSTMGNGTNALVDFWWSTKASIQENIVLIIIFELPILIQIILAFINKEDNNYDLRRHLIVFVTAVVLWVGVVLCLPISGTEDYSAYGAYHSRFIDTDSASSKLGVLPNFIVEVKCTLFSSDNVINVYQTTDNVVIAEENDEVEEVVEEVQYNQYEGLDFVELGELTNDETIKSLCEYLSTQENTNKNEYTGLFEGKNLIYICAESFSRLAIDEEITPTLYKMANNSIVLNNYYNSFKNVTTNGEYAFLTGLWPNVVRENTKGGNLTGTMGQSINKNMSQALGNMFNRSERIVSRGYHNYLGYYYGRNQTLPNMGFTCKFMSDGMEFTTSWPSSDLEMFEQSVDDYIGDQQFCAYYMTFSGHGNYTTDNVMVSRNIDEVSSMIDDNPPTSALGYLSCNYELEKAMTYLLERLEEAGQLENTVIVLTGDHYPYYLTDYAYEYLAGEEIDYDFGMYKSTCIIYNAGLEENIYVDEPCCNVDILPTILNLFGINYDSRLYAGTDIFSDGMHIAQLYNKSFITDYVKYNYSTGEAEWLIDTSEYDQEKLDAYLENAINVVKNKYMMSVEIEDTDFYAFVFDNYQLD
jgi:lipoteichoic acid synthase